MRILPVGAAALLAAVAAVFPEAGRAQSRTALYAAMGPVLTAYHADAGEATLARRGSVTLPENVQEAWPHPSRRFLYVAWSNNTRPGGHHGVTAFRIDPGTGALSQHGQPVSVAARSVHLTVDIPGKHLLVAYNQPSRVSVHRLAEDGTIGAEVAQPPGLDFGIYAHQIRVDPSNRMVLLPTRGNPATAAKPEDPGAIKVFGYRDGILTSRVSVAPDGGRNFAPRHLDFHPARPFVFVTLEAQNKLQVYLRTEGPSLGAAPLFTRETLADPGRLSGQATSAIRTHPNGRYVYLANRATAAGGENSIVVYGLNQDTGEPTLLQRADTRGLHPRTFAIDPTGRLLVVANMERRGDRPPSLTVFRIASDGKLEFARRYDQDGPGALFWTGMVALP